MVLDPNEVEPNPRLQITGGKKRCRERSTLCSRRERREHRTYTRDASAILVIDTFASIDDPASVAAANDLLAKVANEEDIDSIVSYWSTGQESLKSFDGNAGLALVYFEAGLDTEEATFVKRF